RLWYNFTKRGGWNMRKYLLLTLIVFLVACGGGSEFGKATDVRNDATGNWKMTTTSKKFDVEQDALEYYENHMKDGEIHYIVSFATNTTTVIRDTGDFISVGVTEYKDKEEHDATTIGQGMLLQEYIIYPDGEIEEIDT